MYHSVFANLEAACHIHGSWLWCRRGSQAAKAGTGGTAGAWLQFPGKVRGDQDEGWSQRRLRCDHTWGMFCEYQKKMLSSVYGVKKQKSRIFAGFSDLQNWVSGVAGHGEREHWGRREWAGASVVLL